MKKTTIELSNFETRLISQALLVYKLQLLEKDSLYYQLQELELKIFSEEEKQK